MCGAGKKKRKLLKSLRQVELENENKKLLSRYWQRVMNKNSMLPDYANSGGARVKQSL